MCYNQIFVIAFKHEIMTGTYTQESVISNLTLALLEDSGYVILHLVNYENKHNSLKLFCLIFLSWYHVFYEYGKPLLWGRALGCDFVMSSCKQWIDTRLSKLDFQTMSIEIVRRSELSFFLSMMLFHFQTRKSIPFLCFIVKINGIKTKMCEYVRQNSYLQFD